MVTVMVTVMAMVMVMVMVMIMVMAMATASAHTYRPSMPCTWQSRRMRTGLMAGSRRI